MLVNDDDDDDDDDDDELLMINSKAFFEHVAEDDITQCLGSCEPVLR